MRIRLKLDNNATLFVNSENIIATVVHKKENFLEVFTQGGLHFEIKNYTENELEKLNKYIWNNGSYS